MTLRSDDLGDFTARDAASAAAWDAARAEQNTLLLVTYAGLHPADFAHRED